MAVSFSESVPPQICGVAMPPLVRGWGGRLTPLPLWWRRHCPDSIRNAAYLFSSSLPSRQNLESRVD